MLCFTVMYNHILSTQITFQIPCVVSVYNDFLGTNQFFLLSWPFIDMFIVREVVLNASLEGLLYVSGMGF